MQQRHFELQDEGTILYFRALTQKARRWVARYIPDEAHFGGGFVCEPRYADDIVAGMVEAGLARLPKQPGGG